MQDNVLRRNIIHLCCVDAARIFLGSFGKIESVLCNLKCLTIEFIIQITRKLHHIQEKSTFYLIIIFICASIIPRLMRGIRPFAIPIASPYITLKDEKGYRFEERRMAKRVESRLKLICIVSQICTLTLEIKTHF